MAETGYLVSTVVMGLLGLGVLVFVLRGRRWHHYAPTDAYATLRAGEARPASQVSRFAGSTGTWILLYVLLVLGFLGGTVLYSGGGISGTIVIGALGVVIVAFVLIGVYAAMRENGRSYAQAAGTAAVIAGMLFALAIVLKLVLGL